MLYLEEVCELQERTEEILEEINDTISEIYIKKSQIDELRDIDNEVANSYSKQFDISSPEDELDRLKKERDYLKKVRLELHKVKVKLEGVVEQFSNAGIDLSNQDLTGVEIDEIESFLHDVDKRLEVAELVSNHSTTLAVSEVPVTYGGEYSEKRDIIREMLQTAKAVELYDDSEKQLQFMAATGGLSEGQIKMFFPEYDGELQKFEDLDQDMNNQLDPHNELASYSLDAIVSKADNLYKSRSESASECLRRAKSIERLLAQINRENDNIKLDELIEDTENIIRKLEIKSDSGLEMENDRELMTDIEDIVFKIKDVSYSELTA